jgi:bifunctional DNase/RNase
MIELTVSSLGVDAAKGAPLVVLNDANKIRALFLWIGPAEAHAISQALKRPEKQSGNIQQLMLTSLELSGYKLTRVLINRVENKEYFSVLELVPIKPSRAPRNRTILVDAKPADAIALALYAKVPILVAEEVLAETSVPFDADHEQAERAKFSKFIDQVNASDFKLEKRLER